MFRTQASTNPSFHFSISFLKIFFLHLVICLKYDLNAFDLEIFPLVLVWQHDSCLAIVLITITQHYLIITAGTTWSCGFILFPTEFCGNSANSLSMAGSSSSPLQFASHQFHPWRCVPGAQRSCWPRAELICPGGFVGMSCGWCCSGHSWASKADLEGW